MNCSPFDLKDYFLQELPNPQRREVEGHLTRCQVCREELDRLHLTQAALFALREEEIPQRIAFVSDKVFEPSPWRRWWSAFWGSTARLGFASAAMLSAAILVSALNRPAPAAPRAPSPRPPLASHSRGPSGRAARSAPVPGPRPRRRRHPPSTPSGAAARRSPAPNGGRHRQPGASTSPTEATLTNLRRS